MYVVKFILNFTSRQDFEQLIPNCGENEFYNKYSQDVEKLKTCYYICIMVPTLISSLLSIVVSGILIYYLFYDDNN